MTDTTPNSAIFNDGYRLAMGQVLRTLSQMIDFEREASDPDNTIDGLEFGLRTLVNMNRTGDQRPPADAVATPEPVAEAPSEPQEAPEGDTGPKTVLPVFDGVYETPAAVADAIGAIAVALGEYRHPSRAGRRIKVTMWEVPDDETAF